MDRSKHEMHGSLQLSLDQNDWIKKNTTSNSVFGFYFGSEVVVTQDPLVTSPPKKWQGMYSTFSLNPKAP